MIAQNEIYDICRDYIIDLKPQLGERLFNLVLGNLRSRNLANLTSISEHFDPEFHKVDILRYLMQVEAFFKKNSDLSSPVKCKEAALKSFMDSETACRITDRRLDHFYLHPHRLGDELEENIKAMERYIHSVLGPFDRFLGSLPKRIRFTSGATATRSRRNALPYLKVSKRPVCTPGSAKYLSALSEWFGYGSVNPKLSMENRVELVLKNWKTDRSIACEPDGNVPLQLAFDDYVKRRLSRNGINLSDQFRNQELARIGSIDGSYATLDLSAASDSLTFNTVAWLLPNDWFEYVRDIRSPFGRLPDGQKIEYAKFSSMGNGTTFGLETLVFAAACYAVTRSSDFVVYGDDIIIPTDHYESVVALLAFFGFKVNHDKSYHTGSFRESCGAHWYDGINLTPFYFRKFGKRRNDICHNVNGLVACSVPGGRLWDRCLSYVKRYKLPLIPYSGNSTEGVFIDIHSAYEKKLIKRNPKTKDSNIPGYYGYVEVGKSAVVSDVRTLFLWHFEKYRIKPFRTRSGPAFDAALAVPYESSKVPALSHKFVRKWVRWQPPGVTPLHLYWWAELVLANTS